MSLIYILLLLCGLCSAYASSDDPKSDKESYKEIVSFAKQMHRRHEWELTSIGGRYDDPHLQMIDTSFICHNNANLEEARRLFVQGVQDFLDHINANKRMRRYLPCTPLTYHYLSFGLSFRQNYRIAPQPYIAYVGLSPGRHRVYYCILEPTKYQLKEVHEESFEEALQIIAAENQLSNPIAKPSTAIVVP